MNKKIIVYTLLIAMVLATSLARPVLAQNNQAQIQALQQQIVSLYQQIVDLLRKLIQARLQQMQQNPLQAGNPAPVLTVNASGVTPMVSINGGSAFVYAGPLTLKDGDRYSVTAQNGSSSSKCSGTVSSTGTYTCNISAQ